MTSEAAVGAYLAGKWFEEEGDGLNLIIIDERRRRIEARVYAALRSELPLRKDEHGNNYYALAVLDRVWADVMRETLEISD